MDKWLLRLSNANTDVNANHSATSTSCTSATLHFKTIAGAVEVVDADVDVEVVEDSTEIVNQEHELEDDSQDRESPDAGVEIINENLKGNKKYKRKAGDDKSNQLDAKKTRNNRVYKFCSSWLSNNNFKHWLEKSEKVSRSGNEHAYCKVCDIKIVAHKNDIRRHGTSGRHKDSMKQISTNRKITDMANQSLNKNSRRAELKLCGLLASNNLPFILMDTLSPLLSNIFPDSQIAKNISLKRSKATATVKQGLGNVFSLELFDVLRKRGSFFSLVMDETTDMGTVKQCAFTVIYWCNESNNVKTQFFDMVEMGAGTAQDLYDCLKNVILQKRIPLSNFVGFSSDTCNVMFGKHNSVYSLLKEDMPDVVCIKCSCHLIHLAASKACLKLPRSVEDLLRNLGSHFSRSFGRQTKFKEFQVFFATEIHKILSPAATRWLSLESCVNRVLEQYDPLVAYLTSCVFEDPSRTTEDMLNTMRNKFTRVYLEFMSYTLGLLNTFNTMFQTESPLLHKLKPETAKLLTILCSNYLDTKYVKSNDIFKIDHEDKNHFVPLENIYLGIAATDTLCTLKNETDFSSAEHEIFLKSCLSFYVELVSQIKKRFIFEDDIFDLIKILDPPTAQSFEVKSLYPIVKKFPILREFVDIQELDNEWRTHAFTDFTVHDIHHTDQAVDYWKKVFALKNSANMPIFKNLKIVLGFLLILPFSNVSVERIFSNLRNIKTENRNKLKSDTLTAILYTKQGIEKAGGVVHFEPNERMLNKNIWLEKET